jgi:16S rRNA (guanine527-N7)-methyltransferase
VADTPANDPTAADALSAAVAHPEEGVRPAVPAVVKRVFGPNAYELISRYRDILASRGIDWGLLGPREVERLWSRHILNSASVAGLVDEGTAVADVGSGAGLPGIPVALLRPELAVDLIEPLLRRSRFLTHTVDDLGITGRVSVVRARAEDVAQTYDTVLSRALAPLDRLIPWCLPLMKPTGQILAIKGASARDEVATHQRLVSGSGLQADVVTVTCDPEVEPTTVVRLRLR